MDIGTLFCPNHPDLRFPPFKQECTVCNQPLSTIGTFETFPAFEPSEKEIVLRRMDELDEPKPLKATLKELHETISEKVDKKLKDRKAFEPEHPEHHHKGKK